jgi:hypothetical protein
MERLGQTTLKVDAFFLKRTGFVANQTVLKLGEYTLNCVPATLGVEVGQLLAVLTPSEINLFSKFKTGTHILILTFENPEINDVMRFPLRVGLTDIVPVPDRKNVCFLEIRFKSLPAEFVQFLGQYLDELEGRQQSWEALASEAFELTEAAVRLLKLSPDVFLASGTEKWKVEVASFHTKRLVLKGVLPSAPGPFHLKLTARDKPFVLEGTLDGQGGFLVDFHPEWLELIEDFRFQMNLRPKREGAGAGG